jgi:hypothetical protein
MNVLLGSLALELILQSHIGSWPFLPIKCDADSRSVSNRIEFEKYSFEFGWRDLKRIDFDKFLE